MFFSFMKYILVSKTISKKIGIVFRDDEFINRKIWNLYIPFIRNTNARKRKSNVWFSLFLILSHFTGGKREKQTTSTYLEETA